MNTFKPKMKNGMTLVEVLISLGIFVIISLALSGFGRDIFFLRSSAESNLLAQMEARQVLRNFVSETRGVSPSILGSYPISQAGTSTVTFFVDLDGDKLKEQVRYFLDGGSLKRGVVIPSTNPVSYSGSESVATVVKYVINSSSTPIFEYYDENFTGTSSPLTYPLDISRIRLIKVTVVVDENISRPPGAIVSSTNVTLRNLKNSL